MKKVHDEQKAEESFTQFKSNQPTIIEVTNVSLHDDPHATGGKNLSPCNCIHSRKIQLKNPFSKSAKRIMLRNSRGTEKWMRGGCKAATEGSYQKANQRNQSKNGDGRAVEK